MVIRVRATSIAFVITLITISQITIDSTVTTSSITYTLLYIMLHFKLNRILIQPK